MMKISFYIIIETIHFRASSRETRKIASSGTKKADDGTTDVADLLEEKRNMLVPMAPHTDTKRTSRKGGSSRGASRSSSPVGSVGMPDGDETDGSESMDLGNSVILIWYKIFNKCHFRNLFKNE